jgi:tetratricopeptide (TPR) repeat protein
MRKCLPALFCICYLCSHAQHHQADSLRKLVFQSQENKGKIYLLRDLSFAYGISFPDSSYYFASQGADLARRLGDQINEAICMSLMASSLSDIGDIPKGLDIGLKSLLLAEHTGDFIAIYEASSTLGFIYYYQNDFRISNEYYFRCLAISKTINDESKITHCYESIGNVYFKLNNFDSAIYFTKLAYSRSAAKNNKIAMADELNNLGDTYNMLNKDLLSLTYYKLALNSESETEDMGDIYQTYLGIANIFQKLRDKDSALTYAYESMVTAVSSQYYEGQMEAGNLISSIYESQNKPDSALKYLKLSMHFKDSLFNQEKSKAVGNMTFEENNRQVEIENQKRRQEANHIRNLQLLAIGLFIPIFFLGVLFLSRTRVQPRVVEFLGILSLLLFFEFITDLLYPLVSDFTNESPVWEMLILVLIAALLEPLNNKLEHWVKKHLVHPPFRVPLMPVSEDVSNGSE